MLLDAFEEDHPLAERFRCFIQDPAFCCVGAKATLARSQLHFIIARSIASGWDDLRIHPELIAFAQRYRSRPKLFQSFVVLYEGPRNLSEAQFEHFLWDRLQSLTDKDIWSGQAPDPRVSADPSNPHFSLSFGGEAFFVVGLHPNASRASRRFEVPAMVFNLHDQFDELRSKGMYEKMRQAIIERDVALAGSVNPMLARHGEASEARQYSGRMVGDDWTCPLRSSGRS